MITLRDALDFATANDNKPIYVRYDHKHGWKRLTPKQAKQMRKKLNAERIKIKCILDDVYAIRFSGIEFILED